MMTSDKEHRPAGRNWLSAMAIITLAMLVVAALLNGLGRVGVAAVPKTGGDHHFGAPELAVDEQVRFGKVDRALGRLDISEDGQITEDEPLEPVLDALAEALPAHQGQGGEALGRARFLLEKSLPPAVADQFVTVMPGYLRYRRAEQALAWFRGWRGPDSIEDAYVQHLVQHQLRRLALGETAADRLFEATFRLTDLHFSRQMLMRREDLNDDEKKRLMNSQVKTLAVPDTPEDAG